MTYTEVVEGVRAAIATYTHALDDGRTDDVLATFCADGGFEMAGVGSFRGREDLRAFYEKVKPRQPQRHLVTNTVVTEWTDDEATALSDVVLVVKGESEWSVRFVARYRDTLHRDGDRWKFHQRTVA